MDCFPHARWSSRGDSVFAPIVGADVAEVHHSEAPGSRLTILDRIGHYPMLDALGRWTEALLALLTWE